MPNVCGNPANLQEIPLYNEFLAFWQLIDKGRCNRSSQNADFRGNTNTIWSRFADKQLLIGIPFQQRASVILTFAFSWKFHDFGYWHHCDFVLSCKKLLLEGEKQKGIPFCFSPLLHKARISNTFVCVEFWQKFCFFAIFSFQMYIKCWYHFLKRLYCKNTWSTKWVRNYRKSDERAKICLILTKIVPPDIQCPRSTTFLYLFWSGPQD